MKSDTFTAAGLVIVRQWDRWNGALFIAWKPSVSMAFRERKALLKFVSWPAKTPTGDRLREWLNSFEQQAPEPAPDASELSQDVMATPYVPPELIRALESAEAALADIGEAEREPGDNLAWAENRAAQDLPRIRAVLARWGSPPQ